MKTIGLYTSGVVGRETNLEVQVTFFQSPCHNLGQNDVGWKIPPCGIVHPPKSLCGTYDPSTCNLLQSLQNPVSLDIREKQPKFRRVTKKFGTFFAHLLWWILGDINGDPPLIKLNAKTCFVWHEKKCRFLIVIVKSKLETTLIRKMLSKYSLQFAFERKMHQFHSQTSLCSSSR